ncbi:MAG: hypothetical protein ACTHMH_08055 [Curtobacterium sp.]
MTIQSRATAPPGSTDRTVRIPVTMHWSLTPFGLLLLLPLPALLGSLAVPPGAYPLLWGQPYFLTPQDITMAVLGFVILLVGSAVVLPAIPRHGGVVLTATDVLRVERATRVMAVITFVSYAAWLAIGVVRGLTPTLLLDALTGQGDAIYTLKQSVLVPVSGVTTWAQLGVIVGPLAVLRWKATGRSPLGILIPLGVVVLARSEFFSERLALIEVALSTFLVWAVLRERPLAALRTPLRWFASAIGAVSLLVAVFAALEYSRSWITYYVNVYQGDLLSFSVTRLLGYYATSLNNGALKIRSAPTPSPLSILQGSFSGDAGGSAIGTPVDAYHYQLSTASNPEFNNVSGLLDTVASFGVGGSIAAWSLFVLLMGWLVYSAARGHVAALIAYASLAVSITEVVRIYYLGASRAWPVLIVLVVLGVYLGTSATRRRTGGEDGPRLRRGYGPDPGTSHQKRREV